MTIIAGIRYFKGGSLQFLDVCDSDVIAGQQVVVRTEKGLEMGTVVTITTGESAQPGKDTLVRCATRQDVEQEARLRARTSETLNKAQQKIDEHQLPMRLLSARWSLDGSYVTFTFWAEDRVDFRELVRELARLFHARIELHQVGARERAQRSGGLGRCGRPLCCTTWLFQPPQVTVQMAREQDLLESMPDLTGSCGRLLCCLRYEFEDYLLGKAELPQPGELVLTGNGVGAVVRRDLMRDRVTVRIEGSEMYEFPASEVRPLNAGEACGDCPEGARPKSEVPFSDSPIPRTRIFNAC